MAASAGEIILRRFFYFLLLKSSLFLLFKVGGVNMTNQQKVLQLKKNGFSYRQICDKTGLSLGTIKSICSRAHDSNENVSKCIFCDAEIRSLKGKKHKKFCSDKCRMSWWNSHRNLVNVKTLYKFTCNYCKKEFTSHSHKTRKYCSHACYLEGRYGDGQ